MAVSGKQIARYATAAWQLVTGSLLRTLLIPSFIPFAWNNLFQSFWITIPDEGIDRQYKVQKIKIL